MFKIFACLPIFDVGFLDSMKPIIPQINPANGETKVAAKIILKIPKTKAGTS